MKRLGRFPSIERFVLHLVREGERLSVDFREFNEFFCFFMASFKFLFSSMKSFNIFSLFFKAISLNSRRYSNDSIVLKAEFISISSFFMISLQFEQGIFNGSEPLIEIIILGIRFLLHMIGK